MTNSKMKAVEWVDENGQVHYGNLLAEKGDYQIIDCEVCGYAHATPIPSQEELQHFYEKKYYQTTKPDYAQQQLIDKDWWDLVYSERLGRLESALGRNGSVLDIGCGPGFFLAFGSANGWDVEGIEPSELASEYARGLGVKCTTANFDNETVEGLGRFDVVQINQAIEHIAAPRKILELCKKVLRPEGLVCVVAANDFSPFQRAATELHGLDDWWVIPPEHLNYFNLNSLSKLIDASGFEVISRTATFPIDIFLLMGDVYIGNSQTGAECHARRKKFEHALAKSGNSELKDRLYTSLAELGLGREIEIIGRLGS